MNTRPVSPTPEESDARELAVGYSPCPNDTFIFYPLVSGRVPCPGVRWRPLLEDVETLNRMACERQLPVTKISFHAFGHLRTDYVLLSAGSALGRGCGPLLVARDEGVRERLETARVAIPGKLTSAALLLRLFAPELAAANLIEMSFEQIFASILQGEVDAGLIIHESRFTYRQHGLVSLVDLGEWWEERSGLPIPLGGIIADRRLGRPLLERINESLRESVLFAKRHPEICAGYIREHAQELSDDVTRSHIELYVNDFTVDLGAEGRRALDVLLRDAAACGAVPEFDGEYVV